MSDGTLTREFHKASDDFARVLDSEAVAEQRLAEARADAQRIHRDAALEERRIAARAERRLRCLHAEIQTVIEAEKARRVAAFETERVALSAPPAPEAIAAAAQRLARRLAEISEP